MCVPDEDFTLFVDLQSAGLPVCGDDAQLHAVQGYTSAAELSVELLERVAGLIADAACFRQTVALFQGR